MTLLAVYAVFPLFWLVVNSTKSMSSLFSSFSLWFSGDFALWDNIHDVLTRDGGEYIRWFSNTIMYTAVGAGGATLIAAIGGYGLAKFDFPGRKAIFGVVVAAVAVPSTALTVPTFLLFSQLGLTNTPLAVILPTLVTPFGLFLMWTYASESIPTELIEAARLDGAGEFRIFFTIAFRLMTPGIVSVLLLELVASWNNYFLPLIMLNDPSLFPLTVGLNQWNAQASAIGGDTIFNLVLTGSLLMIVPIIVAFLLLQRFWQAGLSAGSLK
jgi:multiple sugar transport system permease protein